MGYDGRIQADARHLPIADESVQMCVTSPPYFGLRDYGHAGQIGLEKTPQEYIQALREVFGEVWRVLRPDGVLWLNVGDSYAGSWGAQGRQGDGAMQGRSVVAARQIAVAAKRSSLTGSTTHLEGLKPKDLIGIPWMLAFALREDGWYLRSDVIWAKPNPMPESVTDRPTRAHEYLFLLAKSEKYYYDHEAIKEDSSPASLPRLLRGVSENHKNVNGAPGQSAHSMNRPRIHGEGYEMPERRNKRSVWTVSTAPYPEAHYATFPPALIEPCILAGSRPGDFVLDPFAGSGTVGRVCEQYSRRWIGVDLGYQDLQEKRLRNLQKVLV